MSNKELDYQNLIQRRDNLIEEIREIERGWVESLPERREMEEARDKALIRKLNNSIRKKGEQVKYELRRFDSEWIGKVRELRQIDNQLMEFYQSHLESSSKEYNTKKAKIKELKRSFPYLRKNVSLLASTIDSSYYYVDQFKLDGQNFKNEKIPKRLKRRTSERDNHRCVRCGKDNDLQVHHIIPMAKGGDHELENLALLCENCHRLAHKGHQHESGEIWGMEFDKVAYDSVAGFWNDWTEGK